MQSNECPVARLQGATKSYGKHIALDRVDLLVERGSIVALLGPNGAGKSTTISLLLGLTQPDQGAAELFRQSPRKLSARRRIGIMLQSAALPDTSHVGELLRLTASYYPRPRTLAETLRIAGIQDLVHRRYGALSGGQQRRVQFALAVCGNPELLFLDEPTTGLDIEARESLWAAVQALVQEGCAVLLTTHYIEEAEALAHRVTVLMSGRVLVAGSVDDLRAQSKSRRIRCISKTPVDQVLQWPGVTGATRQDQWLNIDAPEAEAVVGRLLQADPRLSELEVRRAGLSEAFVQLTQGGAQ